MKVAEKEQLDRHGREIMQTRASQIVDHGGGGAEVEMLEVEAVAAPLATQPDLLVVDEAVLETVLGVSISFD